MLAFKGFKEPPTFNEIVIKVKFGYTNYKALLLRSYNGLVIGFIFNFTTIKLISLYAFKI